MDGACGQIGDDPNCTEGANGKTTTRWQEAVSAINQITLEQKGKINFGLSIYPKPEIGENCTVPCNIDTCGGGGTLPGTVDVPVALNSEVDIASALAAVGPAGGNPHGPDPA